jgi:hypothetical protein
MTKLQIASLQVNRGSPRADECLEWVECRVSGSAFGNGKVGQERSLMAPEEWDPYADIDVPDAGDYRARS